MWCVNAFISGTLSDEGNQTGAPGDTVGVRVHHGEHGELPGNIRGRLRLRPGPTCTEPPRSGSIRATRRSSAWATWFPRTWWKGTTTSSARVLSVLPEQALQPAELDTSCVVTTAIVPCDAAVDVNGRAAPRDRSGGDDLLRLLGQEHGERDRLRYFSRSGHGALWLVDVEGPDTTAAVAPDDAVLARVDVTAPEDATCEDVGRTDLTAFALCNPAIVGFGRGDRVR